jgi:RNA polymerase sigma-70 factor (ECF subfamily)
MGSSAHPEPDPRQRPDESLAREAAAGSRQAFDLLVARHARAVYALARRFTGTHEDADDIAQETFLQVWRSLQRYDPERPFRPWLNRIAANMALKHLRRRRSRREVEFEDLDGLPIPPAQPGSDPSREVESGFQLAAIRRARLKPEDRLLLHLRAEEGMSYAEIAAAMELPMGTVMSRLHRARRSLRAMLAEEGVELLREGGGDRVPS